MVREASDEPPVLLYDGTCHFCNTTVQFLRRHDRSRTLRLEARHGQFAARVLAQHPALRDIDSVVWIDPRRNELLTRSAAGLRVARCLGGLWRLALVFWIVPRPIRDWGYDLIARHRHQLIDARRT